MNVQEIKHTQRLRGKVIFLSASVPNRERSNQFRLIPDAQVQIEEAVVSLTRAVLAEGGRLVFGGHPSISPLVGLVAAEYALPRLAEGEDLSVRMEEEEGRRDPLIQIFQSEAYREYLPDETWQLFRQGFATIQWIPVVGNERYNPEIRNEPQCRHSLHSMRQAMLERTRPSAMLCIGGMEGVIEETELYQEMCPTGRIYVFETTGGAAYHLARNVEKVRVIDRVILDRLVQSPPEWIPFEDERTELMPDIEETEGDIRVIPYPLICQLLVQEIAQTGR